MRKSIKVVYLYGPIEHSADPDSGWRYVLERLLKPLGIKCINPVKVSFLVGKTIRDNAKYARKLKREGRWLEHDEFMKKIWGQDKRGVDPSSALICWVKTQKELRELNASCGSHRELCRGERKGKKLFLVCEVGLANANSHLVDIVRGSGAVFENVSQLIVCLKCYNKTGAWKYDF